ncbi:DUF1146 family protein [Gemella haemolysans]|mgnify:CR=1 FL=1|uniref:DUF1146 domain-containing protein n=2 Tax=Gemella haemolysans TaxID=1379 RepID=A0AA87AYM7_9BACL|nr:DUF1146 family protein [Gemella haemolysans]EGF87204.1 hypothetical protein HMPREF0428_00079 [Gemella haemolysans M341]QIX88056.1 DUF1146 domain-containing protein [Gemella haemolysans]
MSIFKLSVLFFMILLANFSMLRIDFGKFFKKNSTREIKVFVSLVALALGYIAYMTIITIYELSLTIVK